MRYRSTLAAYREARRQGESRRARALARRVSTQGDRVSSAGRRLSADFAHVTSNSTINLTRAREITSEVTGNVSATTGRIRTTEFRPPRLNLSSTGARVSFADPATLRGQLRASNETPLAGRTVTIRTPETTIRTETNASGSFTATYRPTTVPTGNATVVAEYRPRNDSPFSGIEARTTLSVGETEGTLRVTEASDRAAFGDEVSVRGTLRADGRPVAGVPVVVTLGGVRLAAAETNASGGFSAAGSISTAVPAGNSTLDVSLARRGRALTADPASTVVSVERTEPRLVAGTERLDPDTVRVFGSLTAGRTPVKNATLRIRRGTDLVATVRLDGGGAFERNVSVLDLPANGTTTMVVAYEPPGGNLDAVSVQVRVSTASGLPPAFVDTPLDAWLASLSRLDPALLAIGALALLMVSLVSTGAAYRSQGRFQSAIWRSAAVAVGQLLGIDTGPASGTDPDADGASTDAGSTPDAEDVDGGRADGDATGPGVGLLDAARGRLDGGRLDEAVVVAYGAARRHLDASLDVDPALTHWELLAVYREALDREDRAALERLTAAYERAAFSPARSTTETARLALENAATIVGRGPGSTDPMDDD
ncbi:DUF4129 domain-containing protein [Haloplanus litoreus]|uniref:DUF4129 domain-containing protein n=1 Tax=Haloplanus litoreus TaxID=767515 RepID=UPI0036208E60